MWIVSHIICCLVGVVYSVSNWLLWPYFYAKNVVVVVDIRPPPCFSFFLCPHFSNILTQSSKGHDMAKRLLFSTVLDMFWVKLGEGHLFLVVLKKPNIYVGTYVFAVCI